MTSKIIFLILLCLIALGVGGVYLVSRVSTVIDTVSVTSNSDPVIDPVFRPVIDELKAKTGLPIRLPQKLPESLRVGEDRIYATIENSDYGYYSLNVTTASDCKTASCRLASLTAISGIDRVTIEYVANVKIVELVHGISGMHHHPSCVNVCTGGWINWSQGNVSYSVDLKEDIENDLIPLVNSIIDAEPIYTDDLTKWNRYENDKHGISFYYPYNWTLVEKGDDGVILDNLDLKSIMPKERCAEESRCLDSLEGSLIKISWQDSDESGGYVVKIGRATISFMHAKTRSDLTPSERVFLDNIVSN